MIRKRDIGAEILEGIRELKAGKTGRVVNLPEVASIRAKTGLSQAHFARPVFATLDTVRQCRILVSWSVLLRPGCLRASSRSTCLTMSTPNYSGS